MAANIRSYRNGITPVDGASRNDLEVGDVVLVTALSAATTYSWVIAFAPEGSTAAFSGSTSAVSPGSFTVDKEGPYLIKLTVDAGLATESTQYVRLRALTAFGGLTLIAAGERRDSTGIIPVDVDVEGWANEQNQNIQTLKGFVQPLVSSGRILYVDANDGTTGYADHPTIQAAIDAAVAAGATSSEQWVVAVRPGTYVEDVIFKPFVHVVGWPGNADGTSMSTVVVQAANAGGTGAHTTSLANATDSVTLANLRLLNSGAITAAALTKSGSGTLRMLRCRVQQNGVSATQGPAVDVSAGTLIAENCVFRQSDANGATRFALQQSGASTTTLQECRVEGPSGADLNTSLVTGVSATYEATDVIATNGAGVALRSSAATLTVERSTISGGGATVLSIHPGGGAYVGAVTTNVRYSVVSGALAFNTTGITGSTTLLLSATEYTSLSFPGGAVTSLVAGAHSKSVYYDNSSSALAASNVQDAIDILASGGAKIVSDQRNVPEAPNTGVAVRGWASAASTATAIRVYMDTVNTQGNFTVSFTNEATGNTMLNAATFNMNTLVAGTVTNLTLTGTASDLTFAARDRWTATFTSDDPAFDGEGIYFEIVFTI